MLYGSMDIVHSQNYNFLDDMQLWNFRFLYDSTCIQGSRHEFSRDFSLFTDNPADICSYIFTCKAGSGSIVFWKSS